MAVFPRRCCDLSRAYPAGLESGDSQRSADERVWRLDSFWKDRVMAKPYSDDLRVRAIAIVEGGASRHEVAALLEVSPSSVINWLRRWSDEQLCSEAERRKRLAIGEARGLVVGADPRASGSDVGRSGCGDAQTTDRRKPQRFVAVFHPARHHL